MMTEFRVGLTGGTSALMRGVIPSLNANLRLVMIGRDRASDKYFDMKRVAAPSLHGLDYLIHAAWPMDSRDKRHQEMAAQASQALLDQAVEHEMPFLFISTVSACERSRSHYARSKWLVEHSVEQYSKGMILRLGFISGTSSRASRMRRKFLGRQVAPVCRRDIPVAVSKLDDVCDTVNALILNPVSGFVSSPTTLSSLNELIKEHSPDVLTVSIPNVLLTVLASIHGSASWADAWKAVTFRG